jgi:hypothetical protein
MGGVWGESNPYLQPAHEVRKTSNLKLQTSGKLQASSLNPGNGGFFEI